MHFGLEMLNNTGKIVIKEQLRVLAHILRNHHTDQHTTPKYVSKELEEDPFRFVSGLSLLDGLNMPGQFDFAVEIERLAELKSISGAFTDFAKLFFDILSALRGIPECVEDAFITHRGQCPEKCFQELYKLRDNIASDAGKCTFMLEVSHLIGYFTAEAQKLCNDVSAWDWIGRPHPRPPFDVYDLVMLGSEAAKCAADFEHFILQRDGKCFPQCKAALQGFGGIVAKYIHVSGGKLVNEFATRLDFVCQETKGVCFSSVDGASVACNTAQEGEVGTCKHGVCVIGA